MKQSRRESWAERFPAQLRRRLVLGLAAVTLVAFAVRVPLLGTTYRAPDTAYYLTVAHGLFHGAGFASNLRPPAYATLLATFELFGANPVKAAVVFQNLVGMVFPAFVLLVGWRFFSPLVGIIAGFLAAASPLVMAIEQFALTDYLFSVIVFVAAAVLAEALLSLRRDQTPWGLLIAAGALFGVATLLRANGLYGLFAIPAAVLIAGPRWKPALRASGIAVAALALVITPWCIHNLIRFGDPNVASEGGISLFGRAIAYDQVKPPTDTSEGRVARRIYNTADPSRQEAAVGTTGKVLNAFVFELGLDPGDATGKMGAIAREAILDHPAVYLKDSLQILGRYQGIYYPRTLIRKPHADQIALVTRYVDVLDPEEAAPSGSALTRGPWEIAQALTEILFILTGGGLLMLTLPFLGDRRNRVAAIAFLTVGLLGLLVVVLTARFELRHGVVFAPFIWILAPATVFGLAKLVASLARRPRLRTRNATT